MSNPKRGVVPIRRPVNPGQAIRASTSVTSTTSAPNRQPVQAGSTRRPPAPATSAPGPRFSKFARPPFSMNKAPDDGNQLGGAFGKLELDDSGKENASKIPEPLLKQARKSGQLNLSARGLTSVPMSVWKLLDPPQKPKGFSIDRIEEDESWWENVDLTKLILASNQLTRISGDIKNLPCLTVLDVHDNRIEELPDEIGLLEQLSKINLNHNELSRLPDSFFDLRNLRSLTVCHNKLVDLGQNIGRLDMLDKLDVAHNSLTELPGAIGYLTKMTHLDISHNNISALPQQIGALRHLFVLNVSNNCLTDLEDTLADMARLEQVYLQHNQIKKMPKFRNCPNLKEIHLGFNRIEELGDEDTENVAGLKLLDLKENKIRAIPESIINLAVLERLDVSNNDLSTLPPTLGMMPHLKALHVDGNPMKTIRRDILQRGTVELMKFLRSRIDNAEMVQLKENDQISPTISASILGSSPPVPDAFTMRSSQMLTMSKKDLTELPKEAVENAIEARVSGVDLSKNKFEHVPETLGPLLPQISQLDVSFNKIEVVPAMIGSACALQYLNLSNNKLKELPDEISMLANLREICIAFNKFEEIPPGLYKVPSLEVIVAENNKNNNLEQVPPLLGRLTQIRTLKLEGNGLRVPRAQILSKGTESIMAYLRDRIPQE